MHSYLRTTHSAPGGEGTGGSFRCFCLLLSLLTKVGRAGARNTPIPKTGPIGSGFLYLRCILRCILHAILRRGGLIHAGFDAVERLGDPTCRRVAAHRHHITHVQQYQLRCVRGLSAAALSVDCPPALLERLPETDRPGLLAVLANDPRPRYQNDPQRLYGLTYAGCNVTFRVEGGTVVVVGVE